MRRTSSILLALVGVWFTAEGIISEATLTHFTKPLIRWKNQLGCGTIACAGLKRNNALVLSDDGSKLYLTRDDGSLVVLNTTNGRGIANYVPSLIATNWTVSNIGSGVSVHQQLGDIVYAVQDSPPPFRWTETFWYRYEGWYQSGVYNNSLLSKLPPLFYPKPVESSRLVSLDSNGKARWTYQMQGLVVGTPIHGGAYGNASKLVYVLLNVNNTGQFTVLRENNNTNGTITAQVLYRENSTFGYPYSPMTIVRSATLEQDALYWYETMNREPGYDPRGKLHRITVQPKLLKIISSQARHEYVGSATRPLIDNNGTFIYVGGYGSRIHKLRWKANEPIWKGTNSSVAWTIQMDQSLRNETMPLMASPILSSDRNLLFAASTATSFYCINATTGAAIWKLNHKKKSIYTAEAKLSPDDAVLYSVLHMDGTVIAQDSLTGSVRWEMDCATINGANGCYDSVEAEFALSPDGTKLYYSDFKGKVVSLLVANVTNPAKVSAANYYGSNVASTGDVSVASLANATNPSTVSALNVSDINNITKSGGVNATSPTNATNPAKGYNGNISDKNATTAGGVSASSLTNATNSTKGYNGTVSGSNFKRPAGNGSSQVLGGNVSNLVSDVISKIIDFIT